MRTNTKRWFSDVVGGVVILAVLVVVVSFFTALFTMIRSVGSTDDSDGPDGPSGMRVLRDNLTGCEYLATGLSGLEPRRGPDGKQICREAPE